MDIDSLVQLRAPLWRRFEQLLSKSKLTGPEADEFLSLYRQVSLDLVRARDLAGAEATLQYLTGLTIRGRSVLRPQRTPLKSRLAQVLKVELPATLYRARWFICGAYLLGLCIMALQWHFLSANPQILRAIADEGTLRNYANEAFVQYYFQSTNATFATSVWANNASVALVTVALSLTGIGPFYVLYSNALNVGRAGAVVSEFASPELFFSYILPHGQLELSAIFIATGAAAYLFWRLLVPGRQPRLQVLAAEGQAYWLVLCFLVVVLAFSGLQEGFVTPSNLPIWLKIGQGTLSLVLLWAYILLVGRKAARVGPETGTVAAYLPVN